MDIADLRQEYMRAGLPLANAMTLATVTAEGAPDARVVLLKGVEGGGFVFYTNYDSRKGRQLAARPEGCLVFLWTQLERQVRVEGQVAKVSSEESDKYFSSRPVGSRLSARASAQSSIVGGREMLENEMQKQKKQFGDNPPRPANWGGYRLMPARIEFWQGRENRLHDRLLYTHMQGNPTSSWTIERLAP